MGVTRSRRYEALADETTTDYHNANWPAAKQWLRRVGLPRLIAESATWEAHGLLKSINAGVFRNDPVLRELLHHARAGVDEFVSMLSGANWARFEGTDRQTPPASDPMTHDELYGELSGLMDSLDTDVDAASAVEAIRSLARQIERRGLHTPEEGL